MENWLWFKGAWCKFPHNIEIYSFLHEITDIIFVVLMLQCIVSPNMVVCKPTWCEIFFGYTMPLIIAIRVRFIFLSAKSSTSYRNQRGSDIAWLQHPRHSWRHERYVLMFNTSVTNCTLYFHRYEFEIYKHHCCQLCLAPLGSYWQCEFVLICTYSVKADWGHHNVLLQF